MTRKFSDISWSNDIWLVQLIESKISKFESRFERDTDPMVQAFSNAMQFILIPQVKNIDSAIIQIFELLKANPDVSMDSSIEWLWSFCSERYISLFGSIKWFNEQLPSVNDILISNEWQNFQKNIKSQFHEFDAYQSRFSEKFEKINEFETRTYTLLSLIKSTIIESKWIEKPSTLHDELKDAKDIAKSLIKNKSLIESAIQSSESIQQFNVNNIDEALKNVWEMFYNKDAYLDFLNTNWTYKEFFERIKSGIGRAIFLAINDFFESPKWWLFVWLIPIIILFTVLFLEYSVILDWEIEDLQKYKDFWTIIVSLHLIWASFLWYITVFCLSNFKKLEQRHEAYRFRWVLTRSFGFLLKTADEEQKKILYPKALDAIFKDLPESNTWQDVNINLPVTEIMKWISWKI